MSLSNEADKRIRYHTLAPRERHEYHQPVLPPMSASAEWFDAGHHIQTALTMLRNGIEEIVQGLVNPQLLEAATKAEALDGLCLNLEDAGRRIMEVFLSSDVQLFHAELKPGSVVHWVIRERELDCTNLIAEKQCC